MTLLGRMTTAGPGGGGTDALGGFLRTRLSRATIAGRAAAEALAGLARPRRPGPAALPRRGTQELRAPGAARAPGQPVPGVRSARPRDTSPGIPAVTGAARTALGSPDAGSGAAAPLGGAAPAAGESGLSGLSGRAPGGQGAAVPDSGQGSGAGHEAAVRSAPDDRREPDPVRSSGGGGGQEVPGGPPRDYGRDPAGGATTRDRLGAWAELLRVSALFTVPGDALAGAAALGVRPGRGTALAIGTSLCLYEAGMALNDWADRDEDAIDRPHRPIPSGRITPRAALTAAAVLTATGLTLASRAGRPALAVATALAATVWSYDLHLKHTKAGPAAMAAARSLDLLLGATATASRAPAAGRPDRSGAAPAPAPAGTGAPQPNSRTGAPPHGFRHASAAWAASAPGGGSARPAPGTRTVSRAPAAAAIARGHGPAAALPAALALGAHTYAVTSVSRHETQGGSTGTPLAALAATLGTGLFAAGERTGRAPASLIATALAGAYIRSAGKGFAHAALNPSPPLTQRAVGGGIRAMIPLQAALAARAGNTTGTATALALTGLVPLARALARKVSLT